jgi:phage repressor protein C with HTH and peptisase S24 domain
MKTFFEIIETIKKLKKLKKDYQVADLLGIKRRTLATDKARNTIPLEELSLFCNKEGIFLDLLLNEDGYASENDQSALLLRDAPEFVSVPQVYGRICAGGGLIPDNTIEMRIAFRRDWIRRKGDPEKMSITRIKGDSMEPTLIDGDLVLVDHGRHYVESEGGIYALHINDEIVVRRIQVLYSTRKVQIISDNREKYPPMDVEADQIKINGKVIWFARELER